MGYVKEEQVLNTLLTTSKGPDKVSQTTRNDCRGTGLHAGLNETVPDAKDKTHVDTLDDTKGRAQMHTFADALAEAKAETPRDTSRNIEADTLVDKVADKLGETETERLGLTLRM